MRFGDLGGQVASILRETKTFANPFGIRLADGTLFHAELRRSSSREWEDFCLRHELEDPQAKKRRRAALKAAFTGAAQRGFRTKRKAAQNRELDALVDDLVESASDTDAARHKKEKRIEGIATILWVGGTGFPQADGTAIDLSDEATRREILGYNMEDGKTVGLSSEFLLDEDGKPQLDDEGQPIENPWFGKPFGASLAEWMEQCSDDEDFQEAPLAEAAKKSGPSPSGSMETGSSETPIGVSGHSSGSES